MLALPALLEAYKLFRNYACVKEWNKIVCTVKLQECQTKFFIRISEHVKKSGAATNSRRGGGGWVSPLTALWGGYSCNIFTTENLIIYYFNQRF